MIKKISGLVMLIALLICSVSLSVTYSKYLLTKNVGGQIKVPEVDYCIRNGINKLSECMLVMENYSTDVNEAKAYIATKNANVTKAAPTVKYVKKVENQKNENGIYVSTDYFTMGTDYSFDEATGMFSLKNYIKEPFSEKSKGYYTCGSSHGYVVDCFTLYYINDYKIVENNQRTYYVLTDADVYSYNLADSFDSEIGLYQAKDDTGISYYYRGNVKNNYVSYAGYIWRIIRQNGNGSIRMIYSGTSATDVGVDTTIATSAFNIRNYDPTYVGYMYGSDFQFTDSNSSAVYTGFSDSIKYVFASSYTFDDNTKKFSLSGNTLSGVWNENYNNIISNYPYTCFQTDATKSCDYVIRIVKYIDNSSMYVNHISYSSKSYDSTLANTNDSSIKTVVDKWYANNLLSVKDSNGNLYTNYLSDEIFCNDRLIYNGNGYLLDSNTLYNSFVRILEKKGPSYLCSQLSDRFTISSVNGNGKLAYPIGLLTADEAMYAGALYHSVNENVWLDTGYSFWTMTPAVYSQESTQSCNWFLYAKKYIEGPTVTDLYGVRPVINLRSDIKITSGDGSANNPYEVSL